LCSINRFPPLFLLGGDDGMLPCMFARKTTFLHQHLQEQVQEQVFYAVRLKAALP